MHNPKISSMKRLLMTGKIYMCPPAKKDSFNTIFKQISYYRSNMKMKSIQIRFYPYSKIKIDIYGWEDLNTCMNTMNKSMYSKPIPSFMNGLKNTITPLIW